MTTESKLTAALDMAQRGFAVFPLVPNGKTPLVSNWQNLATTDKTQITAWWNAQPQANIGHPTVNEVVIDVDPKHGGGDSFQVLQLTEDLPRTLVSETQSGGNHIVYALPAHTIVRGGANKLGQGIDIRSWGGYIVCAGSTIDGRPYKWLNDRPVAAAPQWLIDKCNTAKRDKNAGERIVEEDDAAVELAQQWLDKHAPDAQTGTIDDTAFKVAAKLYDFGISRQTAREMLTQWSELHAFPPMQPDRIATVADSAGRNRANPIGVKHPDAAGFEPVAIAEPPKAPTDKAKRGLYFLSAQDAAGRALTHNAEPLVEGMRDCGTMAVVYGESNSGKSFSEMDLDYHIARGEAWAGRSVKQGAVLWVAAEGGAGVYKRVAALRDKYGDAPFYVVPCPVNLLSATADVGPLVALCKEVEATAGQKVVKITLDTLSRVIAGGDENSSVDMGKLVHHFDAIREATGAHLSVIHHTGKDKAKGARGHSLLRAATDTEIEVDGRTITVTKQRDLDGDAEVKFRLVPVRVGVDARGKEVTSCWVDTGDSVQMDVDLTDSEFDVLCAIIAGTQNTTKTTFQTADVMRWCQSSMSDTPPTRPTISGHMSALSDKCWLISNSPKRKQDQRYTLGCRKVSEGVGSRQDRVSDFLGTLEGRENPTCPTEKILEDHGIPLTALAEYRKDLGGAPE